MSADSVWVIVITLGIAFVCEFFWHRAETHFRDRAHMDELLDWIEKMYVMGYRDGLEGSIPVLRLSDNDAVPEAFTKAIR